MRPAALSISCRMSARPAQAEPVRIAFGDIASVESLNFLIALERAKERGVEVEVTFFKSEDIAAQAVVSGQADIGVGTPYALFQKVKAPIRMFFQLSALRFYPIVNTEFYKGWKDLDGEEFVVHSRGSGTEAIINLMAQREGITLSGSAMSPARRSAPAPCSRATSARPSSMRRTVISCSKRAAAGSWSCRWRASTPATRRFTRAPISWSRGWRRSTSWSRSC